MTVRNSVLFQLFKRKEGVRGLMDALKGVGVQQYKMDVTFRMLMECVDENLYVIPGYQRGYFWDKEQITALVESLLYGLPIPPIYAYRNKKNQLEIIDGQQRLISLFFYYIGYFFDTKKYGVFYLPEYMREESSLKETLIKELHMDKLHIQLKEKDGKLVNADYDYLSPEFRKHVDYRAITIVEIKFDDAKEPFKILEKISANLNT